MPVYVDHAKNPYGRMKMCHMVADTMDELLEMAKAIQLDARHFQMSSSPHFDLSQSYRARAVALGAIEVDRKGLVAAIKRHRDLWRSDPEELKKMKKAHSSTF